VILQKKLIFAVVAMLISGVFVPEAALAKIAKTAPLKIQQSIKDDNLKFDLQQCKQIKESLSCRLLLTNLDAKDRVISLCTPKSLPYAGSQAISDDGEQFPVDQLVFGANQTGFETCFSQNLSTGVPMKVILNFKTPSQVNKLSLLELKIVDNRTYTAINLIKFRDIVVIR
jgi:hypothetical protein